MLLLNFECYSSMFVCLFAMAIQLTAFFFGNNPFWGLVQQALFARFKYIKNIFALDRIVSPLCVICFHLGCYYISIGASSDVIFDIKANETLFVCLFVTQL